MSKEVFADSNWENIRRLLPEDVEESARTTGAVNRKLRKFGSAVNLLRVILVYASAPLSLRLTAGWAVAAHVVKVSANGLDKRLAKALPWLVHLFVTLLQPVVGTIAVFGRFTVVLCDATTVNRPGHTGTDMRVHLAISLAALGFMHAEVTDDKGGETFERFEAKPGQLWTGDRGYGYRKGIWSIVKAGADVLVRIGWQAIHMLDAAGETVTPLKAAKNAKEGEVLDIPVTVAADPKSGIPAFFARLLIIRKSAEEAEKSRCAVRKRYRKLGRKFKAETLDAAGYVFLLTTASAEALPAPMAAALYRLRWQIELCFKRQKSLLGLDLLMARKDNVARAVLYAKLLAMVLCERMCPLEDIFASKEIEQPEGTMPPRWLLQQIVWQAFKQALGLYLTLEQWKAEMPEVYRRLVEPPRKRTRLRQQQLQALIAA